MSTTKIARITGFLYLLLVPLSIFSLLYIPSVLTTAKNISASEPLFRLGIAGALLVQLINLAVVLLLYKLLKSVNQDIAAVMVILFIVGIPITMLNELNQFAALLLSGGEQSALVPLLLSLHKLGILIAQIFWGLWLLPLGYLVFKSGFLPKVLGVLLMVGCFGYFIDSFAHFLFPAYSATLSSLITLPAGVAELLFALWLLIKGVTSSPEDRG